MEITRSVLCEVAQWAANHKRAVDIGDRRVFRQLQSACLKAADHVKDAEDIVASTGGDPVKDEVSLSGLIDKRDMKLLMSAGIHTADQAKAYHEEHGLQSIKGIGKKAELEILDVINSL